MNEGLKEIGIITIKGDDVYLYTNEDYTYLYSGYMVNTGFIGVDEYKVDEYKVDDDLSLDQNIQDFIEFLEEEAENE